MAIASGRGSEFTLQRVLCTFPPEDTLKRELRTSVHLQLFTLACPTLLLVLLLTGCTSSSLPDSKDLVLLVPGAGGDGPWYSSLREGLTEGGVDLPVRKLSWGAPLPLYIVNLQDTSIHDGAERKLAERIIQWRQAHPDGKLILLGHSAGCGVILGAMARLDPTVHVDHVVLLAPSVSPAYDLHPAAEHVDRRIDVFHSDRDTLWLQWRTGHFGTYDNVKTPAAGNVGFDLSSLDESLRGRITQHPYDPDWQRLGNDGGHSGALSRAFVARIIAPLLRS
ncbi:MAG: hypothetical protein ACHRHE_12265 [Tepidisphaerales bacterium]